jgi:negative regulator of sigma E activity
VEHITCTSASAAYVVSSPPLYTAKRSLPTPHLPLAVAVAVLLVVVVVVFL